jgi:hypothetical protein
VLGALASRCDATQRGYVRESRRMGARVSSASELAEVSRKARRGGLVRQPGRALGKDWAWLTGAGSLGRAVVCNTHTCPVHS